MNRLIGRLSTRSTIKARMGAVNSLKGRITIGGSISVDYYKGSYVVTPKPFEEQTLLTKDKFLTQNIKIKEIPYYEITNPDDGVTVYIGSEV